MQVCTNTSFQKNSINPTISTPKTVLHFSTRSSNQDGFASLNKTSTGNEPRFGMDLLKAGKTLLKKTSQELTGKFKSKYSSKNDPYAAICNGWHTRGSFNDIAGCALIEPPVVEKIKQALCKRISLKDQEHDQTKFKQMIRDSIAEYQQSLQNTEAADDHFAALYLKCGKDKQSFAKSIETEFNNYADNVYVRPLLLDEQKHKLICLITKPNINVRNTVSNLEPSLADTAAESKQAVQDLEARYKDWKKNNESGALLYDSDSKDQLLYEGLNSKQKTIMQYIDKIREWDSSQN